jgi:hypothetical protein
MSLVKMPFLKERKQEVFSFILLIEKDKPRFLFGVRPGVKGI